MPSLKLAHSWFRQSISEPLVWHKQADYLRAVTSCCALLEVLLTQRLDSIASAVRSTLPEPACRIRFLRSENGVSIVLLADDYSQRESASLLLYLCRYHFQLPPETYTEALVLFFQKATRQLIHSRLPWWAVRLAMQCLHYACFYLQRHLALPYRFMEQSTQIWSHVLHEPHSHTLYLYRMHGFYENLNYYRRLRHLQQQRTQNPRQQNFHWPQRSDFQSFNTTQQGSYVILSIHMGDFFGAFRHILREVVPQRTVFALRREWQFDLPQNSSLPVEILQHGEYNPARLVAALRRSPRVLAAMFDLSKGFGQTTPVEFFDRRMEFVRGPAELAIVSGIPIVPFVCFERSCCNTIEMESVVSTMLLPGESLNEAVARITQTLVKLAENWIRSNPAQWRFLHSLSSFGNRAAA